MIPSKPFIFTLNSQNSFFQLYQTTKHLIYPAPQQNSQGLNALAQIHINSTFIKNQPIINQIHHPNIQYINQNYQVTNQLVIHDKPIITKQIKKVYKHPKKISYIKKKSDIIKKNEQKQKIQIIFNHKQKMSIWQWFSHICQMLSFSRQTYHLTLNLFESLNFYNKSKTFTIALTCLILAAKFEENFCNLSILKQLVQFQFKMQQIIKYEEQILIYKKFMILSNTYLRDIQNILILWDKFININSNLFLCDISQYQFLLDSKYSQSNYRKIQMYFDYIRVRCQQFKKMNKWQNIIGICAIYIIMLIHFNQIRVGDLEINFEKIKKTQRLMKMFLDINFQNITIKQIEEYMKICIKYSIIFKLYQEFEKKATMKICLKPKFKRYSHIHLKSMFQLS